MKERVALLCWIVAAAAFLALLSCSASDGPGQQFPCEGPEDCTAQERCTDGFCAIDSSSERTEESGGLPEPSTESSISTSGGEPTGTADDYQQPCERDSDCESGICLRTPEGSFCSRPCAFDDECEGELDWICARVAEGGRDTVQICFPAADFLCDACVADTDCGGRQDQCVGLNNGSFCGSSCAGDGICPEGYDCVGFEGEEQCVPTNNYCGECFNLDFSANVDHCGGCGQTCSLPGAINACVDSQCTLAGCQEHRANCDGLVASGCEVDLRSDPAHCGACDAACSLSAADALCVAGACVIDRCDANRANCDGDDATGCEVNTATDLAHCGACDVLCALDNAQPECLGGECRIASCESGFANCNDQTADGCETNLGEDDENCGACNLRCTGGSSCESGACRCPGGEIFFEEECREGVPAAVRTDEPSSLTTSSVTLRGFVEEPGVPRLSAHGLCWFEGVERPTEEDDDPTDPDPTDPDAGEVICTNQGSVDSARAISHALTGLVPGSEWTYFAWGEVPGAERIEGEEITFRVLQEPVVRTEVPTGLTTSSAVLGGEVMAVGVPAATRHGVCWGREIPQPSLTNATCEDLGAIDAPDAFVHTATGLSAGALYTVRAFVVNEVGTRYGESLNFRVRQEPVVATGAALEVASESVRVQGSVTRVGVPDISDHGICLGDSPEAALPDAPAARCERFGPRAETGSFAATFDGLTAATNWYYTAFAEHATGLYVGETREVRTWQESLVQTNTPTQVTMSGARLQGVLERDGIPPTGSWGFCWAQSEDFAESSCQTVTTPSPAVGAFSLQVSGLLAGTRYWYRAWAENEVERSEGALVSFRTQQEPAIETLAVESIDATSASLGGDVIRIGNPGAVDHGVCVGTLPNPGLLNASCERLGAVDETGPFRLTFDELAPGTEYRVRAFIVSELGTFYGEQLIFLTEQAPLVATEGIVAQGTTALELEGRIVRVGRPDLIDHGICLALEAENAIPDDPEATCVGLGARSETGTFRIEFSGLASGTRYIYRAWARNDAGLALGEPREASTWRGPVVSTFAAEDVSESGARLLGEVGDLGVPDASGWGFCYDSSASFPDPICVLQGGPPAVGPFSRAIVGLSPGEQYWYRAWAENAVGRAFGEAMPIATQQEPVIETLEAQEVGLTTASLGARVTRLGNPVADDHGVCWGTLANPGLLNADCLSFGAVDDMQPLRVTVSGLLPGREYTVRAYAQNELRVVYGAPRSFATRALPAVETEGVVSASVSSLELRGRVTAVGRPDVQAHGICIASSASEARPGHPSSICVDLGARSVPGAFSAMFEGLFDGATYWYRAWATNAAGEVLGEAREARTWRPPSVLTLSAFNVTQTSALLNGRITALGNPHPTAWGFCFDTNASLSDPACVALATSPSIGDFALDLSGLQAGTRYWVQAWAENSVQRVFGDPVSFLTQSLPVVRTDAASPVGSTSATLRGTLEALGVPGAFQFGFCWGDSPSPGLEGDATCQVLGSPFQTGPFALPLSGLTAGTDTYFRAFATSTLGTSYGVTRSFGTQRPALVTTLPVQDRSATSLHFRGRIDQEPFPARTAQGFCWSSTSLIPDESDSCISVDSVNSSGVFAHVATGLTAEQTWRVRAWVDNDEQRVWGGVEMADTCSLTESPTDDLTLDATCDGIPGADRNRAIFVRTGGSQDVSICGTLAQPCGRIDLGLQRAVALSRDQVLVATGSYEGPSLQLRSGVSVYGGYSNTFGQRSQARPTFTSTSAVGARAESLGAETRVDRLIIMTPNQTDFSASTIALVVDDSADHLIFNRVSLRAGEGGRGQDGSAGSNGGSGAPGMDGGLGPAIGGGNFRQNLGPGGDRPPGDGGRGANAAREPGNTGVDGSVVSAALQCGGGGVRGEGSGNSSSFGTSCTSASVMNAGNGQNGCPGASGDAGAAGGGAGTFSGLAYVPAAGEAGSAGNPGGSAGGGGGGGGRRCNIAGSTNRVCGGGGGGGGGGGAAGQGGAGGGGGGASIALLIRNSAPSFFELDLRTGNGGDGGSGGTGGVGGEGGARGIGSVGCPPSGTFSSESGGTGGNGGIGGMGGSGGCGGGGGGGPSVGAWGIGSASLTTLPGSPAINFVLGFGGDGGTSCGGSGASGIRQQLRSISVF